MRIKPLMTVSAWLSVAVLMTVLAGATFAEDEPEVDNSKTSQKLQSLPRKAGPKVVVAIHEFRSSVPEIQVKAAQEMFTTALIKSGTFAVAERQRLNEGVFREKQLNKSGQTTGSTASSRLAGASYVFEVVVSEANAGESQGEGGLSVGGMEVSRGKASDAIGMDVRIVDVESGLVVDAVNVRKKIASSSTSVSGLGRLAQSLAGLRGRSVPLDPDVRSRTSRKESLDKALRSCMEAAVHELARRFGED